MLVLLCSWLTSAQLDRKSYDVVEAFAGKAELSRACRMCKFHAAAADLSYDAHAFRKGGMDLTTPSGFVSLASNQSDSMINRRSFAADLPLIGVFSQNCMHDQPRLLVLLVLRLRFGSSLALFAMCCSSFVTISRSSTGRSILVPMGNTSFEKVRTANLLASRHCFDKSCYVNYACGLPCDGSFTLSTL